MKILSVKKITPAVTTQQEIKPPSYISNVSNSHNFVARVVLHRLDKSSDYVGFHEIMADLGFVQFVNGFDTTTKARVRHKMPSGMYYFDAGVYPDKAKDYTLEKVYELLCAAVAEAVKDATIYTQDSNTPPSVFVSMSDRSAWVGLEDAPPAA